MKYNGTVVFSFLPGVILAAVMGVAPIKIATITSGEVIKGSSSALYYLASDGKRYVFPNDKSFYSWYPDFSQVQTVPDAELSTYTLGGNVTYRPGLRLVKIQSDPKVYAVDKGGILRWINSESAAAAIFGSNWNKNVDDIADAFFVNYTVGKPITSSGDYNPTAIASIDTNIDSDKNLIANSTITPTPNPINIPTKSSGIIVLSTGANKLLATQLSDISVDARDTNGIASITIYVNGLVEKNCSFGYRQADGSIGYPISIASNNCSTTIYGSSYANGSDVSVYALETDRYGNTATSNTSTLTMQNGTTKGTGSVSLSLAPYASTLSIRQSTIVTASAIDANSITSIIIYVNGSIVQTCPITNAPTVATCATALSGNDYTSDSIVNIYAQEFDRYGNASSSPTSKLTIKNT